MDVTTSMCLAFRDAMWVTLSSWIDLQFEHFLPALHGSSLILSPCAIITFTLAWNFWQVRESATLWNSVHPLILSVTNEVIITSVSSNLNR